MTHTEHAREPRAFATTWSAHPLLARVVVAHRFVIAGSLHRA
jgi:hypothetical protein